MSHFARQDYGGIEVADRLAGVTQPTLVLAGRKDRTCTVAAAEAISSGIPDAELVVFERSGHMTFVEENERHLSVLSESLQGKAAFLERLT